MLGNFLSMINEIIEAYKIKKAIPSIAFLIVVLIFLFYPIEFILNLLTEIFVDILVSVIIYLFIKKALFSVHKF